MSQFHHGHEPRAEEIALHQKYLTLVAGLDLPKRPSRNPTCTPSSMTLSRPTSRSVIARGLYPPRGPEQFIEEVRGDDPRMAAKLRIEERELEAGGRKEGALRA